MDDSLDVLGTATGVLAPATWLLTVSLGAALSPGYAWPTEPFSVIGRGGDPLALAFDAGLVLGGALALPFAVRLYRDWNRAVGGGYALGGLAIALAGVFPMGSGLHAVAAGFFVAAWLTPTASAVVDWRAGRRPAALAAFALGSASVLVWLPYDLGWSWAVVGYGFAELVVFAAFGTWSAWTTARLRQTGARGSTAATAEAV